MRKVFLLRASLLTVLLSVAGTAQAQEPVHLRLAFDPSALTVTAGSSATVVLSLPGVPEGTTLMAVLHGANTATARVMLRSMMFTAETPRHDVTVVGVAEGSVTVDASVPNFPVGSPVGSVQGGSLVVTVVAVMLQLAFDPSTLTVVAGGEAAATLSLLDVPAGVAVTVELSVADATTARVVTESVVFTATTPSREVTVAGVVAGNTMVTASSDDLTTSDLPPNLTVVPAELAVTVVPAPVHLQLAFDPPELTVAVDSERTAVLSLSDVPAGAAVTVELSAADGTTARVSPQSVVFTAETPSRDVTVEGEVEGSATVTAIADADALANSDLPAGSTVASVDLVVTVVPAVPAPVTLQLAFDPPEPTVAAGATATVVLSLPGVPAGVEVTVELSAADETTARVLPQSVVFTAETPSREVTVEGVAAGSATLTASADADALARSFPEGSSVAPAELAVTVVPPTIDLQLAFAPMSLEVAVGATATAVLRLSGVPVGAAVTVSVFTEDSVTAQVVTEPEVVFDVATQSRDVTVLGEAAGSVTLTAELVSFIGLSTASSVASADLAVTVVPAPVRLQLAFDPMSLTVTAGSSETAVLRLPDVPAGAEVTVAVSSADTATALVGSMSRSSVVFTATTPSHEVTIEGVSAGRVAVTAEVAEDSGLPPDSTVVSTELPVTVVPAPVRLQLAFSPPSLTVTAGSSETVTLRLPDVPAGATVTVALSTADAATALVGSMSRSSVVFTATPPSHEVTIEGVSAGRVAVTAEVAEDSGLPSGSNVLPAVLDVTVVPAPVRLQLAFDPTSLTVTAGSEETVELRLPGVPAGATVTVALSTADTATAQVESMPGSVVTFTATTPSHEVTIEGVSAGRVTVTAIVDTFNLPDDSSVASAVLDVTVVPAPVRLQLAFDPSEVTVTAGSVAKVRLGFSGEPVPTGAEITVTLSMSGGAMVQVRESRVFRSGVVHEQVNVTGVSAGRVTVTAVSDVSSGLPEGSTVLSAELSVTVEPAPADLALVFDPPTLTVAAGATATAGLSLLDVPAGAEVTVAVSSADTATALVMPSSVAFTATTPSHAVTVAGVAEGSVTLTAVADVSGATGLPANSTVVFAELSVTVEPAPVELQLAFDRSTLTVAAGSEATATLRLPDVPAGAEITVTLSVADETTAVRVVTESVVFTATTPSHAVTLTGVAAGSVTVTAVFSEATDLPPDSTVLSAELSVTVEPAPVDLALAFDRSTLTVTAGSEATATLRLLGVPAGTTVTVTLSSADTATALVMPSSVAFTATTLSHAVTVAGVAEGSVTLTAEADVSGATGLPAGSTVASAALDVTVVPAPVELQLAFDRSMLTIAVGDFTTAVLSLLGDVPAAAAVPLVVRSADDSTARVVMGSVSLGLSRRHFELEVLGVSAGRVTVTAIADVSGATGLPPNSTVALAELAVTVVLPTVDLALAFDPSTLTVVVGREATAMLRLPGVPAGAEVVVALATGRDVVQVVGPRLGLGLVTFDADTPSREVTVRGVAEGSATVTAFTHFPYAGLSEASTVAEAQLQVTVTAGLRLRARVLLEGPLQ